jgi:hypothetical protein
MGFGPLGIPTSLEPLLGFSQAALLQWDIKVTPPGHYFSVACDSEVVGTVIGRCTIVCDVPVVTSFMLSKKKVLSPPDQPATDRTCLRRVCCASPPGLGACSRPISQHTRLRSMARGLVHWQAAVRTRRHGPAGPVPVSGRLGAWPDLTCQLACQ